jgi:hypothetical protein
MMFEAVRMRALVVLCFVWLAAGSIGCYHTGQVHGEDSGIVPGGKDDAGQAVDTDTEPDTGDESDTEFDTEEPGEEKCVFKVLGRIEDRNYESHPCAADQEYFEDDCYPFLGQPLDEFEMFWKDVMRGLYQEQPEGERFHIKQDMNLRGIRTQLWEKGDDGILFIQAWLRDSEGTVLSHCQESMDTANLPYYAGIHSHWGLLGFEFVGGWQVHAGDLLDIVFFPSFKVEEMTERLVVFGRGNDTNESEHTVHYSDPSGPGYPQVRSEEKHTDFRMTVYYEN